MKYQKLHTALFITLFLGCMAACNMSGDKGTMTERQTDTIYIYSTRTDTIWVHDTIIPPPEVTTHVEFIL